MMVKLNAYWRLGLSNLLRVACYQCRLKAGLIARTMPIEQPLQGTFFETVEPSNNPAASLPDDIRQALSQSPLLLFGHLTLDLDVMPQWHRSVLNGQIFEHRQLHWSQISDFSNSVGDIKGVWELSRFTWTLYFAQRHIADGQAAWIDKLNLWLNDWCAHNPANQGPNWKCAQETGLRILHLAASALLLNQSKPTAVLSQLIVQHMQRILPTMGYAIAQDNNHGTSEAAALFVGGSWVLQHEPGNPFAKTCMQKGRRLLESRIARLIMEDGTFSQYSVTYHRLLLDTLNCVELWRKRLHLAPFSQQYNHKVQLASRWLLNLIPPESGDTANLGSNDGAHILNFALSPYRDFRSTVELSLQLFCASGFFKDKRAEIVRQLFDLNASKIETLQPFKALTRGGLITFRSERAMCLFRLPNFVFRPAQADIFHVDFWLDGINLLPDGGTFSYNAEASWLAYFAGCRSHNTLEFDQREQMPKVSRFLFGKWPSFESLKVSEYSVTCAYLDWLGVRHSRDIVFNANQLIVTDRFLGIKKLATLRWRLAANRNWQLMQDRVSDGQVSIQVSSDTEFSRFAIAQGAQSLYYGSKSTLPVLEVDVAQDTIITTIISWQ